MARIFYQQDCDIQYLFGKTVAIIGYGSQGHAHALNLKESGVNVIVGLYVGSKSWEKAEKAGLKVMTAADAAKKAEALGMKDVEVRINGPGAGRESAVRGIASIGMEINAIKDITPVPHNGCRPPKRRRV